MTSLMHVVLLKHTPTPERVKEIVEAEQRRFFPEFEDIEYRLVETVPDTMAVPEASKMLADKASMPGSIFLWVYAGSTERQALHGTFPS